MRLFVAVDVGEAVRDELGRVTTLISEQLASLTNPPRVTWVARHALHLTLRFLGEVDDAGAARLAQAFAAPVEVAPFDVEWRGLGAFPSPRHPRALWIGVGAGAETLGKVQALISQRIDATPIDSTPFHAHLTLGRVRTPGAGANWMKILQAISVRQVRSRVERVSLYQSVLSSKGPNYTGLAHAPLRGL